MRILVRNFLKRRYAAAGATRHARLLKIEPRCGEKMGSNPHFGAILDFSGPRKKAHVSTHSTLAVVQDSICAVMSPPRATDRQKKHQTGNSWILAVPLGGVVE